MQKFTQHINPIGIQRDVSPAQAKGSQFVHDMFNKRITQDKESNTFAISSEGKEIDATTSVPGKVIGVQKIDKYIVYFSKGDNFDCVSILNFKEHNTVNLIGDFNFSEKYPIESVGIVETDDIIKVYWVDGLNQPRLLNVKNEYDSPKNNYQSYYFDFQPELGTPYTPKLTVTKLLDGQGYFHSGVVQYAASYYNKNGQESPVFLQSDLFYITGKNRGLSPEEYGSNSFALYFENIDSTYWEYIRVYRIFRSSLNAIPQVEIIGDYKIDSLETKTITEETSVIIVSYVVQPTAMTAPLAFDPTETSTILPKVTKIIFNGKSLASHPTDGTKDQISTILTGVEYYTDKTLNLLNGSTNQGIIFYHSLGSEEDGKKFTVQTTSGQQKTLLANHYYYITTQNNSGRIGDITYIGLCDRNGNEGTKEAIYNSRLDSGMLEKNTGVWSFSGINIKISDQDAFYVESFTFDFQYNLTQFLSGKTSFNPQYVPVDFGGGQPGEAPYFILSGYIKNVGTLLSTIPIYGIAKYKQGISIQNGIWLTDDSSREELVNNINIQEGSWAYVSGNSYVANAGIAVPVIGNELKMTAGGSTDAWLNYQCIVPIEAINYFFVGTGSNKVSDISDLELRVLPNQGPIFTDQGYYTYNKAPISDWTAKTWRSYYLGTYTYGDSRNQDIEENTKIVGYLNIKDTGTTGISYDPQALLFKGFTNLTPYTLTHKDNTLFLGNYSTEGNMLPSTLKNFFKNDSNYSLSFSNEESQILDSVESLNQDYVYNFTLNDGSKNIKHFRQGQVYRIGIQFENKKGQWSEIVFLKDIKCENRIAPLHYKDALHSVPKLTFQVSNTSLFDSLISDYIGMRLAYVEPTILDRNVLCQGIACSTVYNFKSRYNEQSFAQASWFARPEYYGPQNQFIKEVNNLDANNRQLVENGVPLEWRMVGRKTTLPLNKSFNESTIDTFYLNQGYDTLLGLPEQTAFNAEIQGHSEGILSTTNGNSFDGADEVRWFTNKGSYLLSADTDRGTLINYLSEDFGIDRSIMTLHSPDIQWDENIKQIDLNSYKIRLVGFTPIKKTLSDIWIESSGAAYGSQQYGFVKNLPADSSHYIGSSSNVYLSGRGLVTYPFWIDDLAENETWAEEQNAGNRDIVAFPIYPWHRNGALNNQGTQDPAGVKAELSHKILSNLRICLCPQYFNPEVVNTEDKKVLIVDNDFVQNYSIDYLGQQVYYKGNEDSVYQGNRHCFSHQSNFNDQNNPTIIIKGYPLTIYGFAEGDVSKINFLDLQLNKQIPSLIRSNWGIVGTSSESTIIQQTINQYYLNSYYPLDLLVYGDRSSFNEASPTLKYWNNGWLNIEASQSTEFNTFPSKLAANRNLYNHINGSEGNIFSNDAVSIKYKSGDHIVFSMKAAQNDGGIVQFPTIKNQSDQSSYLGVNCNNGNNYLWQKRYDPGYNIYWSFKNLNADSNYYGDTFFYFPVVELYKDTIDNQYGGNSENALSKNVWIPISETTLPSSHQIDTTSGDTYFQRYDHLKTQPYTQEDQNSIVEIVSFPVETYINIDGRYDENRGKESNLVINKNNFNQLNQVYSQTNNYFNYNSYGDEKLTKYFPNQFTWSLEKIAGEEIDSWTNITLLNTYDLDGDKGPLQYLERFNNQIYAFQDTGLARIIFNPRVQIPVSDGVPIEMGNSRKLEGVVYISDTVGNQNKWAIAKGKTGIYFLDKINNSFNKFNGERIESLSDQHFNKSFMLDAQAGIWDINNTSARLLYENSTGDYYLRICIPKENDEYEKYQLAYNENLGTFTSRYDYDMNFIYEIPPTDNSNNTESCFVTNETERAIYKFNHNNTTAKESSITLIGNENFPLDKVFETVEFRANDKQAFGDVITRNPQMQNKPVYNISAKNGHQESNNNGDSLEQHFNTGWLRKKFRVWRAQIPRQDRDRIRDTWSYITLYSDIQVSLYDFGINYYI